MILLPSILFRAFIFLNIITCPYIIIIIIFLRHWDLQNQRWEGKIAPAAPAATAANQINNNNNKKIKWENSRHRDLSPFIACISTAAAHIKYLFK